MSNCYYVHKEDADYYDKHMEETKERREILAQLESLLVHLENVLSKNERSVRIEHLIRPKDIENYYVYFEGHRFKDI